MHCWLRNEKQYIVVSADVFVFYFMPYRIKWFISCKVAKCAVSKIWHCRELYYYKFRESVSAKHTVTAFQNVKTLTCNNTAKVHSIHSDIMVWMIIHTSFQTNLCVFGGKLSVFNTYSGYTFALFVITFFIFMIRILVTVL